MNPCSGVLGVFNIQGASFSRALRRFHTHDPSPPALPATVSPADIPSLRGAAEVFAVYCDSTKVRQPAGGQGAPAVPAVAA